MLAILPNGLKNLLGGNSIAFLGTVLNGLPGGSWFLSFGWWAAASRRSWVPSEKKNILYEKEK